MKISAYSIKRPVFTIVTMLLIIIIGGASLLKIPLKLIPDINPPVGVVVTTYQGASPTEVVEKVTKPLEESLATLPGIKNIQSTSREGSNFILLEFSWTTSIDEIQNEVLQRIDQTPLPDDSDKPRFLKFDPSQFPIIQVSLRETKENQNLQELAEKLRLELTKVNGVASVNVSGTLTEEIIIELNQNQLKKNSLSQSTIVDSIRANNVTMPGDTIDTEGKTLTTRVISELKSVEDIKSLVLSVSPRTGEEITLADVASVEKGKKNDHTITRANDENAVLLSVLQQSDANTTDVSRAFQTELGKLLEQDQYKNIEADILFDQGDYIEQAIGSITNSLLVGGAFAMLVLFLFLKNIKSPIIIGVAIPYSVIVTFVLMFFSDFALNIMTLGALALGIGMLVDNAIVVIENIYRHLSMGKNPKDAAREGTKEVGAAITASTLTTIAVFLPVVFITGLLGQLFTEFALTISFSLFASLVVALTVIPMLASRLLKGPPRNMEAIRRRSKAMNSFERSIRWSLKHRWIVLSLTTVMLVISGYGMTRVGTQFLPPTDEGFFNMKVELENGTSLEETNNVVKELEKVLEDEKDVKVYVSFIGSTQEESFRGTTRGNVAEIYVKLKPLSIRDQSIFQFVDDMKPKLRKIAKEVNPSAEVQFNLQSTSGSSPQTVTFNVRDTDKFRLDQAVDKIYHKLEKIEDVTSLETNEMETIEEIQLEVDREKARAAGLAPIQIANVINDVTRGVVATQIVTDQSEVHNVIVQYDRQITNNLESLKELQIQNGQGGYIALSQIVEIQKTDGPVSIQRINQQNAVEFTLKYPSSSNLGEISKIIDGNIQELDLPEETFVTFSGDRELLESSIDDMVLAIGLAVVLVYIVMAAQFESFKYPLVIMFTLPLTVIGVAFSLWVTNTPISVAAIIGVLVLTGIVVNNAIVIVDYINQKKEQEVNSFEAIVVSVKDRARPILMTALTTILGLLPLALGIGEGTEINQPMGITVIGGLISSTMLTLYVIPIMYSLFDKNTRKTRKKRSFKRQNPESTE
ncbi:HAE1 family hydrophobic/amphiphilic exporter-1 [Bacillus pakistanensis]|uniref:HAE1 family hydrophobic/amphiphilic exporter-1 n=1 Tax=Rossellomorea pakistanensis TaxID=992288 RepID=A0ABS2NFF9_9BACI|nr:efflux RND transporter permease subunit [Bacillus pakistanensis]MBM7586590.1 HAE1 family hydrophobic/amphiphilic exporter-1 [Bacillus pakistanensis]